MHKRYEQALKTEQYKRNRNQSHEDIALQAHHHSDYSEKKIDNSKCWRGYEAIAVQFTYIAAGDIKSDDLCGRQFGSFP